jgi:hypothetical protein
MGVESIVGRTIIVNNKSYMVNDAGKKDGVFEWRWPSGNLFVQCAYVNGVRDGVYTSYWDNGIIWKQFHYRNGILHGDYIEYADCGSVMRSTYMYNDIDMGFDPRGMTGEEKAYAILSGRKPDAGEL